MEHLKVRLQQPVVKVWLHSTGDASPLAALLLPQILPVFSVVAPCHRGASPVSVRRQTLLTAETAENAWFDELTMSAHPEPVEGCVPRGKTSVFSHTRKAALKGPPYVILQRAPPSTATVASRRSGRSDDPLRASVCPEREQSLNVRVSAS